MRKIFPRSILTVFVTMAFSLIYSHNLPQSFLFTSDFGRDIYHAIRIAQGDIVLIGSKMNLGGFYVGPYLYYLLSIALLAGNASIVFLLYFHALLFASSLGFFFWAASWRFGALRSILATAYIGSTPIFITSARYPSNGYTYLALLLVLFTIVFVLNPPKKPAISLLLGILAGVIFNIHPISILALIPIMLCMLGSSKTKFHVMCAVAGFTITFLPLLVFELKHGFVMTKDTFANRSYLTFTKDGNTPQFWLHNNKVVSSFIFLSKQSGNLVFEPPIFFAIVMLFAIAYKRVKKSPGLPADIFLLQSAVLSFILLIAVLRFHFEKHYIFSAIFFVPLASVLVLLRSKLWFLLILLVIPGINFLSHLSYEKTSRPFENLEQVVKSTVDQGLVKRWESFNLIAITDAYGLVPTGYDYRFFFRKMGFVPDSEYNYKDSQKLLIFAETPYYDIDRFKMWATEEFGRQYFINRRVFNSEGITVYVIAKNQ